MQQHGSEYFFTGRLLLTPIDPGGWGQKVKNQLFKSMVMLNIKLNGITNAATCKEIFCCRLPNPGDGVKRSKFNFFRTWYCCISNKFESQMPQHGRTYFVHIPSPDPDPWGWDQKVKIHLFKNMVMLHIKLNGIMNEATW